MYYLGPRSSPGYGVVKVGGQYQIQKRVQLFAEINNLLGRKFHTAAQLGPTAFENNGNFVARPFPSLVGNYPIRTSTFLAPGAPFTVFLAAIYLLTAAA